LKNIKIASSERLANSLFKESIDKSLGEYSIEWVDVENNENLNGIISLKFEGPNGIMQID
jgi:hypothetical protein